MRWVYLKLVLVSQLDQLALVVALHSREQLAERVELAQKFQQVELVVALELFAQLLEQVEHPWKLEWKMKMQLQENLVYCF
jgi:hypothetical protein